MDASGSSDCYTLSPAARTGRWSSPAALEQNLETNALSARHLAGDEHAFGEILKCYRSRLLNFMYRMIGDRERAEDLVQEAGNSAAVAQYNLGTVKSRLNRARREFAEMIAPCLD